METLNYFERAFADPFPSMFYMDLLYGFAGGVAIKLIVLQIKERQEVPAGC